MRISPLLTTLLSLLWAVPALAQAGPLPPPDSASEGSTGTRADWDFDMEEAAPTFVVKLVT